MMLIVWILVLVAAVWAAHWGADGLATPLQKLRKQWGLSEAAGAAFVALATASPEVGTNTVSAVRGLSDIGLGNLLGSNIISVPAIVLVAYLASQTRTANRNQPPVEKQIRENVGGSSTNLVQRETRLDVFGSWTALRVKPEALTAQAIPYLLVIALAALLTLPTPWRGLQPIDGWIMLAAYAVYVSQAILRQRQQGEPVRWRSSEIVIAGCGILALMIGAYFIVAATEQIVSILGISQMIGGVFITSTLSIAPEVFATWSVARSGQMTAATTSVIADNTATMTLAFFPLALVGMTIEDGLLFSVNLAFVALLGVAYAAVIQWGRQKHSFELWEVGTLIGIYLVYLVVMLVWVLKVFS
ncbi:MAG: sodium:calcium exchanger [Cyanobacteria bacterium P01_A01_bin.114]